MKLLLSAFLSLFLLSKPVLACVVEPGLSTQYLDAIRSALTKIKPSTPSQKASVEKISLMVEKFESTPYGKVCPEENIYTNDTEKMMNAPDGTVPLGLSISAKQVLDVADAENRLLKYNLSLWKNLNQDQKESSSLSNILSYFTELSLTDHQDLELMRMHQSEIKKTGKPRT